MYPEVGVYDSSVSTNRLVFKFIFTIPTDIGRQFYQIIFLVLKGSENASMIIDNMFIVYNIIQQLKSLLLGKIF